MVVCLDLVHFFPPLAAKLLGPRTRCQFFKNVCFIFFFVIQPLKALSCTPTYLNPPISQFLCINSYEI